MVQNLNFYVYYTGIGDNKPDHKYNPVEFICLINNIAGLLENFNKKDSKVPILNPNSFTNREWQNLYKLSENTFVEETDSLKQGAAGAGLTDNDWRIQYFGKRFRGFW